MTRAAQRSSELGACDVRRARLAPDWHTKHAWTGYSFDRSLWPVPAFHLQQLQGQGLRLAANLHDALGVGTFEERYADLCAALPSCNGSAAIPCDWSSKAYVRGLSDKVLRPLGFDFWWIGERGADGGGSMASWPSCGMLWGPPTRAPPPPPHATSAQTGSRARAATALRARA